MTGFKKLKAGDVRKKGDEVQHQDLGNGFPCIGTIHQDSTYDPPRDCEPNSTSLRPHIVKPGPWKPTQLLNHQILPSDLMVAEFRRPVEVAVD